MRLVVSLLALAFVSCAPAAEPTVPESPSSTSEETVPPSGRLPASVMDPVLADASERAGVEPAALTILRAEAVTWPNGALGCPQPGMAYPQVLVDGYWVVVEASGVEYDYRGRRPGDFILCDLPASERQEPVPGGGGAGDY